MKKLRIVVIDDVVDILDLIEYNLFKEGMSVFTFEKSKEALVAIPNLNPDIIISDWMMPGLDGLELCKILKMQPHTALIPIIMLTCKASLQDYKDAIAAGASDYVVKPVRMDELVRRIKLLLPNDLPRVKYG